MIHEVWDLDNTVYRKCIIALKVKCIIIIHSSNLYDNTAELQFKAEETIGNYSKYILGG